MDWRLTEWLTCFANHTYQEIKDKETREELDYMPRNKTNLGLGWDKKLGNWNLAGSASEIYVGQRRYEDWRSGQTNTLPGYWKTDLNLILSYNQGLSLRLDAQNATNKKCEVPFKPSGNRPVYCKECFPRHKKGNSFNANRDNRSEERGFSRERRFDKRHSERSQPPFKKEKSSFAGRKKRT